MFLTWLSFRKPFELLDWKLQYELIWVKKGIHRWQNEWKWRRRTANQNNTAVFDIDSSCQTDRNLNFNVLVVWYGFRRRTNKSRLRSMCNNSYGSTVVQSTVVSGDCNENRLLNLSMEKIGWSETCRKLCLQAGYWGSWQLKFTVLEDSAEPDTGSLLFYTSLTSAYS